MKLAPGRIAGLLAGTLLTAAAAAAAVPGAASAAPPPELGYELVSPLASSGFDFTRAWLLPDGDRALIGTELNDINGIYRAARTPGGWQLRRRDLTPPNGTPLVASGTADMSADGSRVLVSSTRPGALVINRLALSEPDGSWKIVGSGIGYVGGTEDLGRFVVQATWGNDDDERYPDLPDRASGVFLWQDDGSANGAVTAIGADAPRLQVCGAEVPDGKSARALAQNGVSPDARSVVLSSRQGCTDPDDGDPLPSHVFHWRDGETTDLTAPAGGEPDGDSTYVGNSADVETVFFHTTLALDAGDANGAGDVYRWDAATGERTRLTGAVTDGGDEVLESAISSDDGSRAWFSTRDGDGIETLWVAARDEEPTPIAVAEQPDTVSKAFDLRNDGLGSNSRGFPAQTTPDGTTLVFTSRTEIDGQGGATDRFGNDPGQVWRATADGALDCLSCFADGSPADAPNSGGRLDGLMSMNRVLSDDGRWIAFETPSALEPDDENEQPDVYVWHDGERSLLSGGVEGVRADLGNVSARGDVMFKTYAELLPWIDDDHLKVYVARIGGGLPAPADPREVCADDGCQGAPGPRVPQPGNPSEGFHGPGDADDPALPFAANPGMRVQRLTAAAKRKLAAGRAATLVVRTNTAGRVSATVRCKAGRGWRKAGTVTRRLDAPGAPRLMLRLSRGARVQLARRGVLRVRIDVVHERVGEPRRLAFALRGDAPKRRDSKRRGARA